MSVQLRYTAGDARPVTDLWWLDDDGDLIDFSSGYTFVLKIGDPGSPALLTKSSGIAGAVGAGSEPDGTPNVVVTWAAGELDIAPGVYAFQLRATTGGLPRTLKGSIAITDAVD